jgi:uncharacterized protein
MPLPRTPLAAALVSLLALGIPVLAAPTAASADRLAPAVRLAPASPATVTVSGEGSVSAAPDLAVVGVGVEASAKTSQAALDTQDKAAAALLSAVRAQGVADRDIRTQSVSLNPVYDYTGSTARLKGYQAAQSFSVKVRQVARTGAVLQAITDAAGDAARINSVAFGLSDPAPLRARAREAAHDDAHAKAEQYARLSGRRLGRLVSFSEDASTSPHPVPSSADTPGISAVPVAPGEIRATATVTAVYELD